MTKRFGLIRLERIQNTERTYDVEYNWTEGGKDWVWCARVVIESVGFVTTRGGLNGAQAAAIDRERGRILAHSQTEILV